MKNPRWSRVEMNSLSRFRAIFLLFVDGDGIVRGFCDKDSWFWIGKELVNEGEWTMARAWSCNFLKVSCWLQISWCKLRCRQFAEHKPFTVPQLNAQTLTQSSTSLSAPQSYRQLLPKTFRASSSHFPVKSRAQVPVDTSHRQLLPGPRCITANL